MASAVDAVAAWARQHPVLTTAISIGSLTFLWLWKLNLAMRQAPPEALKAASASPWTEEDLRKTYERVAANPIDTKPHMPPKLDRRYIVLGGSGTSPPPREEPFLTVPPGLFGGFLVSELLERGHPPAAIRIVDLRPPTREDLVSGPAAKIQFVQGDITSSASTNAAFSQPWDPSVASLPLTVLHTAAAVRPAERLALPHVYDRVRIPNVVGTANSLSAAKAAGASVFIFTSSSCPDMFPVSWFLIPPWQFWPTNFFQVMTERDFSQPMRPHNQYFSNYARSKAEAERLVCAADSPAENFRTGSIRPGNGVYGSPADLLLGYLFRVRTLPTYTTAWVQNWIHGRNLALSQLQLEAALLGPHADSAGIAGRPFLITDPGPPPRFGDCYRAAEVLCESPVSIPLPPPVLLLIAAHVVGAWCSLLQRFPFLTKLGLSEPGMPLYFLQPALFNAAVSTVIDDSHARRSPKDGGIGYRGAFTTMEGVCMQIADWNRSLKDTEKKA